LKWFHIRFDRNDIFKHNDSVFVRQFIEFSSKVKHPEKLSLYSLKFRMDDGSAYYVSSPAELDYKVKALLSRFSYTEVARPNLKLLTLEFGKDKLF